MRKLLPTLFLSCMLTGCIITQYHSLHDIINENAENYKKHRQVEFNNIAAILKSYSNLINSNGHKNLKKDTKQFTKNLKKKNISENYPVRASEKEIEIVEKFLEDVIKYANKNGINHIEIHSYINQTLKAYITEILIHEEKIPQ